MFSSALKDVLVTEFSETRSDRCLPRWEEEESDEDAPEKRLSPEELEEIKQLFKKFDLSPGPLVGIELECWAPCSRVKRPCIHYTWSADCALCYVTSIESRRSPSSPSSPLLHRRHNNVQ